MTEAEIKDKYKALHDKLSEDYYQKHELSKEDFDTQHGKIWSDMEAELIAGSFIRPPVPPRDLAAEIDDLKARIVSLESAQKGVL